MKFIVKKKRFRKQKYYFKIVADNGKTLCSSESYYNSEDVLSTIESLKKKIQKQDIELLFDPNPNED